MSLRFFIAVLAAGLGGCRASLNFRGASAERASTYLADLLRPVALLGAGIGTFRVKEGRWPSSIHEITASAGEDESWRRALSAFTDLSLTRQPDGSMIVAGKLNPPPAGEVTLAPVGFAATVTVRRAPRAPGGWEPQVDAKLTEPGPATPR